MASGSQNALQDVEKQRSELEKQMSEVRRLLDYWQQWDLDYESLKEEVTEAAKIHKYEVAPSLLESFQGTVLKGKDLRSVLNNDHGGPRAPKHILDQITHRLDYVQQNVQTLQKRQADLENRILGLDVLAQSSAADADGLPLTEIVEELDEEGNVVSGRTMDPSEAASTLANTMSKVLDKDKTSNIEPEALKEAAETIRDSGTAVEGFAKPVAAQNSQQRRSKSAEQQPISEIDESDDDEPEQLSHQDANLTGKANSSQSVKLKRQPVIPIDDSPEDASLRREMLEYHLDEVGAVVAEMDLDVDSQDKDDYDYDEEKDEDEENDEDQFGRSTRSMIDDRYRQEMLRLEKKLNAQALANVGPAPGRISPESDEDMPIDNGKTVATVAKAKVPVVLPDRSKAQDPKRKGKGKGVRFADELDISEAPTSTTTEEVKDVPPQLPTSSEDVIERKAPSQLQPSTVTNRKQSRFKASLAQPQGPSSKPLSRHSGPLPPSMMSKLEPATSKRNTQFSGPIIDAEDLIRPARPTPRGPQGQIHADVIEKPPSKIGKPVKPEDMENEISYSALAVEAQRLRNKIIQQNGGYLQDDEQEMEVIPVDEDGNEMPRKKVSRFRAAKLAGGNR